MTLDFRGCRFLWTPPPRAFCLTRYTAAAGQRRYEQDHYSWVDQPHLRKVKASRTVLDAVVAPPQGGQPRHRYTDPAAAVTLRPAASLRSSRGVSCICLLTTNRYEDERYHSRHRNCDRFAVHFLQVRDGLTGDRTVRRAGPRRARRLLRLIRRRPERPLTGVTSLTRLLSRSFSSQRLTTSFSLPWPAGRCAHPAACYRSLPAFTAMTALLDGRALYPLFADDDPHDGGEQAKRSDDAAAAGRHDCAVNPSAPGESGLGNCPGDLRRLLMRAVPARRDESGVVFFPAAAPAPCWAVVGGGLQVGQ